MLLVLFSQSFRTTTNQKRAIKNRDLFRETLSGRAVGGHNWWLQGRQTDRQTAPGTASGVSALAAADHRASYTAWSYCSLSCFYAFSKWGNSACVHHCLIIFGWRRVCFPKAVTVAWRPCVSKCVFRWRLPSAFKSCQLTPRRAEKTRAHQAFPQLQTHEPNKWHCLKPFCFGVVCDSITSNQNTGWLNL